MSDKLLVFEVVAPVVALCWLARYWLTKREPKAQGLWVLLPTLTAWWALPEGLWLKAAALGVGVGVAVTTYGWVYISEAFGLKVKAGAR